MSFELSATNLTDTSVSLVMTLTSDYESDATISFSFQQGGSSGQTVYATSAIIPSGSHTGDNITTNVDNQLTASTTYYVAATSGGALLDDVTITTKATGYNDPRTATQEQWEDLATKVKAKADSSAVPSTYWGQTASNGAVTGDLTLNTHAAHGDAEITSGATLQDGVSVSLTAGGSDIITARSYTDTQSQVSISTIELGGTIDAGSNQINNLAAGTANTDAVNKSQLDAKPTITMTSTDPGEGSTLAANNYVAVYGGDPIIMDYSTSEINTGAKWIDGSAIYKKTFSFTTDSSSIRTQVIHNISNLGTVIKYEGSLQGQGNYGQQVIPRVVPDDSAYGIGVGDITSTKFILMVGSSVTKGTQVYVTLYYTKSS